MVTSWDDIDRMFGAMDLLRTRMNRVFTDSDKPWGVVSGWLPVENWPRANLYESVNYLEMKAEVSGCAKDDLKVKIQGNYLEISGERKSEAPEGYTAQRVERGAASFSRSFTLPTEVDADKVEATLKNGILSLKLPKSEAAKPKQITIS